MVFFRLKSNTGQGVIEYLLLMFALVVISVTVLRSQLFRDFAGNDSKFFKSLKAYMEYTYRYGSPGVKDTEAPALRGDHLLYVNKKENYTRFFMPVEGYPE